MSEPKRRRTTRQLLSEADFHERLVKFFKPFVSARPMDWACIRESVIHFAPLFKFKEFADLYFDYVFGLFEDFRITDRATIDLYFTGYCRLAMYHSNKLEVPVDVRHQAFERNFYGYFFSPMNGYLDKLPSRLFLYFFPSRVWRILRYVAPVITECKDFPWYAERVADIIRNNNYVLGGIGNLDFFCWRSVGVMGRRLKLIVMAVYFVMSAQHYNSRVTLDGIKLFFQAIPDPRVTWQEISGFLTVTYSRSERGKHSFMQNFRETCEICLPKCTRVLKPRSLKHVARCEVRRCLSATHHLPHGVWGLGLPRELEDYVLLQRRKDQPPVIPRLSRERMFAVPEIQSQDRPFIVRISNPKRR